MATHDEYTPPTFAPDEATQQPEVWTAPDLSPTNDWSAPSTPDADAIIARAELYSNYHDERTAGANESLGDENPAIDTATDAVDDTSKDVALQALSTAASTVGGEKGEEVAEAVAKGLEGGLIGLDIAKSIIAFAHGDLRTGTGDAAAAGFGAGSLLVNGMAVTSGGATVGGGPLGLAFAGGFKGMNWLLDHGVGDALFGLKGSNTPHNQEIKQDVEAANLEALDRAERAGAYVRSDPDDVTKSIAEYPDGHTEVIEMKDEMGDAVAKE